MPINFNQAADRNIEENVTNKLLDILCKPYSQGEEFLRINCSHALVRWYYFAGRGKDDKLEKAIKLAEEYNDNETRENLDIWLKKAWKEFLTFMNRWASGPAPSSTFMDHHWINI